MSRIHTPQPSSSTSADISLRERLQTLNITSTTEATALAAQGQHATYTTLVFAPFAAFVRMYLHQGEWRHGISGLIAALFAAYGVFIRYTKLWEQQNVKTTAPASSTQT